MSAQKILIIKLGALGDIILANAALTALRKHYPTAHIDIITSPNFTTLIEPMQIADTVIAYDKKIPSAWHLVKKIRAHYYDVIYDLQTSTHTKYLYYLCRSRFNNWSNHCKGASFYHANPHKNTMHTVARLQNQLTYANITYNNTPNINYLQASANFTPPPPPYALLLAGGAPTRPEKRWHHYSELAQYLWQKHTITPVLIGGHAEQDILQQIAKDKPYIRNLYQKTTLGDIALLAKNAKLAIGNDTGPMHIIGLSNCPSIVLFGHDSKPALCAPFGEQVHIIQQAHLHNITLNDVAGSVDNVLNRTLSQPSI